MVWKWQGPPLLLHFYGQLQAVRKYKTPKNCEYQLKNEEVLGGVAKPPLQMAGSIQGPKHRGSLPTGSSSNRKLF